MKKLCLYYSIQLAINAILLVAFTSGINLHFLSILPAFLLVLMIFQAFLFKSSGNDDSSFDTAYSVGDTVRLTNKEQSKLYSYMKCSFLTLAPFELPIIFFLPTYWKFVAFIPYILAYLVGSICFKIKVGKSINARAKAEANELKEQIKKEELGLK